MAADDFTLVPTWVTPVNPKYSNLITQSESNKKDYQNLSTTAIEKYKLEFIGLSDANTKTILDHYKARYGGYDSFAWKTAGIPGWLDTLLGLSGADLTGRWVDDSLKIKPKAHGFDVTIVFEKDT